VRGSAPPEVDIDRVDACAMRPHTRSETRVMLRWLSAAPEACEPCALRPPGGTTKTAADILTALSRFCSRISDSGH
jgi:hypothetical protein